MADKINLEYDTTQAQPERIDLNQTPTLTDEAIEKRSDRAHFALKDRIPKTKEDYIQAMSSGNEDSTRKEVAAKLDEINSTNAYQKVRDYITSKREGLTAQDADVIKGMSNVGTTDPNSVFETEFGRTYSDMFVNSPTMLDAAFQAPEAVQGAANTVSQTAAKYNFFLKVEEEIASRAENQSWGGYGVDIAKTMFPGYSTAKMRGLVPGTFTAGGFLGTNLDEQRKELMRLPLNEMIQKYLPLIDKLSQDNPQLALTFAHAMTGTDSVEQMLTSSVEALDLTTLGSIGAKGLTKLGAVNTIRNTARGVLGQLPDLETRPAAAVAAAATGDLEKAAAVRGAETLSEGMKDTPKPLQRSMERLSTYLNLDKADAAGNPGNYGQTILNRVFEIIENGKSKVFDALSNAYRVDRVPGVAEESVMKSLIEKERNNYKGIDNAILDIKIREFPFGNVRYYDYIIGDPDGGAFRDYNVARNNAVTNGLVINNNGIAQRITDLEQELKIPPSMEADVHELNRYEKMERELEDLKAQKLGPGAGEGYEIIHSGGGYYINYVKPLTETEDILRNGLLKLKGTELPKTMFKDLVNQAIGKWRTPEETLSTVENEQRKIATHSNKQLYEAAKSIVKPIEDLPNKYWKSFERLLKFGQKKIDPDSVDNVPGYFFKSPGEIEDWYLRYENRMPHPKELEAYWSYKTANEMDRILRELEVFKNKWRQGVEAHQFTLANEDGTPIKSGFVEAIKQNHFPGGSGDGVVVLGRKVGDEKFYQSHQFPKNEFRQTLETEVEQGSAKVYRIYAPEDKPLHGFTDSLANKRIRYVIVRSGQVETKPIQYNAVPRRGGGHLVPDYNYYSKQAMVDEQKIGSLHYWYNGDATLGAHANRAEGEQWVYHMNKIREMIKAETIDAAKAYAQKFMNKDWTKLYQMFKSGQIDVNQEIKLVPKDKSIIDIDKSLHDKYSFIDSAGNRVGLLKDGTKFGSDAKKFVTDFTGQRDARDLFTVRNEGTVGNPYFNFEPAAYVDPVTMLNRGLNRIIQSTYMNDYKIFAAEHWLQQARQYLKADWDEITAAPFWHVFKPTGPEFASGADKTQSKILRDNLQKVRDFIGVPSDADNFARSAAEKLQDSIYEKLGPNAAKVSDPAIAGMKDPLAFVRKLTYHMKMGLFSIPQFFTQFTTHSNLFALSPRHAPSGTLAMLLHGWSTMNASEEMLKTLDSKASHFLMQLPGTIGWKPGWWMEARKEFINSGFGHIGGENVFLDTPWSTKIIEYGTDKFFSWGELPFKVGASSIRTSSYYTSYLEWRNLNPTKTITRADRNQILNRATLLDHNQSRASSSLLHTGIMSIPGQFMAYQMRLTEMMTGHRLSKLEKARLFGVSAVLYGIPVGGLGLYGFPIADYIRDKLRDGEYPVPGSFKLPKGSEYLTGEKALYSLAMEGLPALIMATITSEDWNPVHGNWYNVSKFGAKGLDPVENALDGDKTMWDVFGGASYSTAKNLWRASSPFIWWASSVIDGDQEHFPLTWQNAFQPVKELTGVNHLRQSYMGFTTGRWLSKNDNYLAPVTKANAAFMGLTGLTTQNVPDSYAMQKSLQQREEVNKALLNNILTAFNRMVKSADDPDTSKSFAEQFNAYMAHYPDELKASAMKMAFDQNQPYISRVPWSYFMKNVDPKVRDRYRMIEERITKQQGNQ